MANVGAFFLQTMQPRLANLLVFYPPLIVVRPWTVLTYMFLHGVLMHIGFNMLSLYFFGPRVEQRIGSRNFTILYFLSGLSGALFSMLFSFGSPIIGASAGVFGVMMAFAYFWPDTPIMIWGIIPVPARLLVILTTVLALWNGVGGGGAGIAHFAHLGGYAGAYVYLRWLDRARGLFRRKATGAPVVATKRVAENWKAVDPAKVHEVNRAEVNRILDKINSTGLVSLTPQEKLFLSNFVPSDDPTPTVQ